MSVLVCVVTVEDRAVEVQMPEGLDSNQRADIVASVIASAVASGTPLADILDRLSSFRTQPPEPVPEPTVIA